MKTGGTISISLGALLCGALLGQYAFPTTSETPKMPHERDTPAMHVKAKHSDTSAESTIAYLRKRVKELEKQLAARDTEAEEALEDEPADEKAPSNLSGPEKFRAHMEDLRINNPEKYAQMTNHFAEMRANHIQRVQDRLDLLAAMDISRMSPKQRENHLRYQELIARQTELGDMLRPGSTELSNAERDEIRAQLEKINREMWQLSRVERDTLLRQAALGFGLKGRTNAEAVDTIKAVIQATEGGMPPGGHPPHGGRGWRNR